MKKTLTILLAIFLFALFGCSKSTPNYFIVTTNGTGQGIKCDSIHMISIKEAYIYTNGVRTKIIAKEQIYVRNLSW